MYWMWIVVIALFAYHAWCLHAGRVRFTVGDGVTRRTRWVHKEENPMLYWVLWGGGALFTVLFTGIALTQLF
jgi:uncharacterized membrane protein (DUF106 family)